jgi:transposase-like protein
VHWEELAVMFDFPSEIRRLIYTTNPIEGYNRQLRKVTKTKGSFPTDDAACFWPKVTSRRNGRCHCQIGPEF